MWCKLLSVFVIVCAYLVYQFTSDIKLKCTSDFPLNGYQECTFMWVKFRGNFVDSKRQGFGILESDLIRFSGEWVNDMRNGKAKLEFLPTISENMGIVEGKWKNDVLQGQATLGTYFGAYNITYEGEISQNKIHGQGIINFYKSRGAIKVGTLECQFNNGKMVATSSSPCFLKIFEMEEKNTKLGIKEDHYKVLYFEDLWSSSGYSCNSTWLHKNTSTSYAFNGFALDPESKGEFRSVINYIKSFELYWLSKELILKRENLKI